MSTNIPNGWHALTITEWRRLGPALAKRNNLTAYETRVLAAWLDAIVALPEERDEVGL